jgi:3-dehydroquinate dehydratase I
MGEPRQIELRGRPVGAGTSPLIIVPLVGRTPAGIETELEVIVPKQPDMLEWRIDFFDGIADRAQVQDTARAIRRAAGAVPILLTRRKLAEGGQAVPISEQAVVALLAAACEAQCVDLIDYELSNPAVDMARLRAVSTANGVALVASYHNFECTPDLETLVDRFAEAGRSQADVAKVAVMPRDPLDVLTLLAATYRASRMIDVPLISMSMGGLGALSRVVGWMYGSAATFAVGKSSSAPGQITVEALRGMLSTMQNAVTGR